MAAEKPKPLTLVDLIRESVRDHDARNERRYVREARSDPAVRGAIMDELAALAAAGGKHRDVQREKAKKPRGVGDDGRTVRKLIEDVVNGQPSETPSAELLPHILGALEANGMNAISDKWARELIRQVRKRPA